MSHLEGLNKDQKEAVLAKNGPVLILAGAGAGKTKTITHRILEIIRGGADPKEVLAITFTNKAAKEMRDRVNDLLTKDKELNLPISSRERPYVSTFHSLGVHILKENAVLLGIPRHFIIFDKNDSKRAVKEALILANLDPKQFDPGKIQNIISREKGNLKTLEKYEAEIDNNYMSRIVSSVWNHYQSILKKEKALDFDDLLLITAELLRKNESVRKHYQDVWKYIHVDEYQDTNKVQYQISKLLAESHRNICVVGDIDQTIYSWRGADISNILDFEKDYPDAKVILLEENYRSTQTILTVANRIIEKNKERKDKKLFTKNVAGDKVGLFVGYDEAEEALFIACKAKELIAGGALPSEIVVLYRANFQSRVLEEYFLAEKIAYQLVGTRFFERKEIKDILSYIRAALNPEGLSDIKRIINMPPRGIGKVTLLKILAGQEHDLSLTLRTKIQSFRSLLSTIKEKSSVDKPSEIIKIVLRDSGIEEMLQKGSDEDKERLENIQELVTLATRYDELPKGEGIEKLLSDAALASDQDEMIETKNSVKLMTIHASKGLEFDFVFIAGLEEDLFPHKKINEDEVSSRESEEERRLFYVALTRARKKIFLSYAGVRTIFGSRQVNLPSEFLTDIDEEFLEEEVGPGRSKAIKTIYF